MNAGEQIDCVIQCLVRKKMQFTNLCGGREHFFPQFFPSSIEMVACIMLYLFISLCSLSWPHRYIF